MPSAPSSCGVSNFYVMAQRLEGSAGLLYRVHAFVVERVSEKYVSEEQSDAQCAGITAQLVEKHSPRWRCDEEITRHRARDGVQHRCRVPHRPGEDVFAEIAEQAAATARPVRHATTRGFRFIAGRRVLTDATT